jgi:hypothetical protein
MFSTLGTILLIVTLLLGGGGATAVAARRATGWHPLPGQGMERTGSLHAAVDDATAWNCSCSSPTGAWLRFRPSLKEGQVPGEAVQTKLQTHCNWR